MILDDTSLLLLAAETGAGILIGLVRLEQRTNAIEKHISAIERVARKTAEEQHECPYHKEVKNGIRT